jgi:monoamine oxidase
MTAKPDDVDVIVIGGGVSGLAAGRELARAKRSVILLEARPRLGGRIHTVRPPGWPLPVELGAEFIHGGNPDLWRLVKHAHMRPRKLDARHWMNRAGSFRKIRAVDRKMASVTDLIRPAKARGLSFAEYFRRFPANVSAEDWLLARGLVEGFEAATMEKISARSLAGEFLDDGDQFVVPGGYDQLVLDLADDCAGGGVRMIRDMVARSVTWRRGRVRVHARDSITNSARIFTARAAVITLPLGVLKARAGKGAVRFRPGLQAKRKAITQMQMGHVVRLNIRFTKGAWRRLLPRVLRPDRAAGCGFIHSEVKGVPVWWSHSDEPVMVGWAGGPAAEPLIGLEPAARLNRALASLGEIFGVAPKSLRRGVADWQATEWTGDPFSRGAYSFTAAGQDSRGRELARPLANTLFFAGEATAEGSEVGTVHGALRSGIRAGHQARRALDRA